VTQDAPQRTEGFVNAAGGALVAEDPTAPPFFPGLDGVRGLAMLAVFLTHTSYLTFAPESAYAVFLSQLNVGVLIFFMMSGFLMYRPYVVQHLRHGDGLGTRSYFRRRFFRVYPGYWVALAGGLLIGFTTLDSPLAWIANVALVQTYFTDLFGQGLPQAFTLVVEVSFYLLLPAFALLVRRVGGRLGPMRAEVGLVGLTTLLGFLGYAWYSFGDPPSALRVLPPWLGLIGAGMGLAVASAWAADQPRVPAVARIGAARPWAWWGVAFVAWLAVVLFLGIDTQESLFASGKPGQAMGRYVLLTVTSAGLLVPLVFGAQQGGWVRRFAGWRPLTFLGSVSYGCYLWHYSVLWVLNDTWFGKYGVEGTFEKLVVTGLPITILLGWLSFRFVEQPAIRFGRSPRLRRRSARPGP